MKYESSFKSEADGLEISVMALIPDKKPYRAVVQLVHGMSEHKERYITFMKYVGKIGYVVVMYEQENPCILSGTSADPDGAQYGLAGSEGICGRT